MSLFLTALVATTMATAMANPMPVQIVHKRQSGKIPGLTSEEQDQINLALEWTAESERMFQDPVYQSLASLLDDETYTTLNGQQLMSINGQLGSLAHHYHSSHPYWSTRSIDTNPALGGIPFDLGAGAGDDDDDDEATVTGPVGASPTAVDDDDDDVELKDNSQSVAISGSTLINSVGGGSGAAVPETSSAAASASSAAASASGSASSAASAASSAASAAGSASSAASAASAASSAAGSATAATAAASATGNAAGNAAGANGVPIAGAAIMFVAALL